ncbi:MAG TPA: hypothetical protein VEL76_10105 [Gemmataceae bacterium]|nr:hypothetical protein [Gemmataceae bacterium]
MQVPSTTFTFSGHETFPFRYLKYDRDLAYVRFDPALWRRLQEQDLVRLRTLCTQSITEYYERIGKSCLPCCAVPAERILADNAHALAVADAFPVSPGHTLVILRRHAISHRQSRRRGLAETGGKQHQQGRPQGAHDTLRPVRHPP